VGAGGDLQVLDGAQVFGLEPEVPVTLGAVAIVLVDQVQAPEGGVSIQAVLVELDLDLAVLVDVLVDLLVLPVVGVGDAELEGVTLPQVRRELGEGGR
jgi:hypothetical protein